MSNSSQLLDHNRSPIRLGKHRWVLVYALIAMVAHWPLVASITTHVSYGHETEATVPLLNVWTVWWNADRAWEGFRNYWNSPIFYPTTNTFVFSEAQLTSLVVAPLVWLTGNRVLAYNVYELLIITLNGYSAHCLLRRLGYIPWLCCCGGVMSQILPFVVWQFGVVQLTTLFGIYWTLQAMLDLFGCDRGLVDSPFAAETHTPSPTTSAPSHRPFLLSSVTVPVRLGVSFGLTYWACNYWGLFLALILIPSSICFWNKRLFPILFWRDIVLAGLIASLMIGPFAWRQRSLSREHDWHLSRTDDMVYSLSAHPRDHTDVPWDTWNRLEFPETNRVNVWGLGGGGLKLLLVPFGFIAACVVPHRRRWGFFVLVFGVLAFGLSLGPTIRFSNTLPLIGEVCPYALLQQYVPGFALIRSPFRFAVFVQIAAVWLTIEALDLLNPIRWSRSSSLSIWAWVPLVLASIGVALESVPPKDRLYAVPSHDQLPVWVVWLRDNAEPGAAVACLPFPGGNMAGDYEETTLWMYWGTFHRHALLNGYSGFFPQPYNDLRDALELFQTPAGLKENEVSVPKFRDYAWNSPGLAALNASKARYVVVKRSFGTQDDVTTHSQTRFRWALVVSDEIENVDIYELPSNDD